MKKHLSKLTTGSMIAGVLLFSACEEESSSIMGCMDENASNYNSEATESDESCEYSNTYLLSMSQWNLDTVKTGVDTLDAMYNTYFTGMTLDFSDDGTYSGMMPGENGVESTSGTWEFMMDETMIAVYEEEEGEVDTTGLTVEELSMDALNVSFEDEEHEGVDEIQMNFKH